MGLFEAITGKLILVGIRHSICHVQATLNAQHSLPTPC